VNLIEGIQAECNRIRDEAIPIYESLPGGAGRWAVLLMRGDIAMAEEAIASGDAVLMVTVLARIKETGKL
jgi:hypothetical protein